VSEGLRGTEAAALFDGVCRRLVAAGVPLWWAFAGMPTLHPQWGGYGYIWWRHLNAIQPSQFEQDDEYEQEVQTSPFGHLMRQAEAAAGDSDPWLYLRRRLVGSDAQLDFPNLKAHAAAASHGTGIGYSFATDPPAGFREDDLTLLKAVLPAVSLAMMTLAGHAIAAGLLAAYLGADAGRRVHAGAIERGSIESIRAVLWYADIRAFTAIADTAPGQVVIELLDEIFEMLTASRPHGG
jgi:adenylate cyclase